MNNIVITPAHLRGGVVGVVIGGLLMLSAWVGAKPQESLFLLAECDGRGWVTVRFPDGGEFMCTPTEQKPLPSQPPVRKFKRSQKTEKVETIKPPEEVQKIP
jgi:hypothetical protein